MKCIKLTYKSPMFGSIQCHELEDVDYDRIELTPEEMEQLWNKHYELDLFLNKNYEDLAEYAPQELKDIVVKAMFGGYNKTDYGMFFLTEIYVREEPSHIQTCILSNWIEGQMSDGWGECVEQREFMEQNVYWTQPTFNTDECEWEIEDLRATVYYYVHPWNADKFTLELIEDEDVELDIPEPESKEDAIEQIKQDIAQILLKLEKLT